MTNANDDRIPVLFGTAADAGPEDAVLRLEAAASPFHGAGCACCAPRGAVGRALGGLFLARARGEVPYFRRVVVVSADVAGVRAALASDILVAARFRMAGN
jgi:hypothetical protein